MMIANIAGADNLKIVAVVDEGMTSQQPCQKNMAATKGSKCSSCCVHTHICRTTLAVQSHWSMVNTCLAAAGSAKDYSKIKISVSAFPF
jgi:hypothetical protein